MARHLALCAVLLVTLLPSAAAQLPAFPGAEGFGATTPGGRGGRVIAVTNLNDSGAGSLRAALEASGPRIVVFRVSGTIELASSIDIRDPHVTVAGQTAPGDGIALKSPGSTALRVKTHDVVLRYLRIRPGPGGESDGLAIQTAEARDIIVDHCSITWGVDESVSLYTGDASARIEDVTFQYNIIADALDCSTHSEGCHSKGLLLQYSDRVTLHHNLFANNGARSPMLLSGRTDAVNNVVYNWGGSAVKIENRHGDVSLNYVGNYIAPGEDSDITENGLQVKTAGVFLWLDGNIAEHSRPDDSYPEDAIVNYRAEPEPLAASRFDAPAVTTTSAAEAYEAVLAGAGATLPARDRADANTVAGVRNRTGRIIDHPDDVGGYPVLESAPAPADADGDGMPDTWETDRGLDPDDAADGALDRDGDGYTNVEEYINGLVGDGPAPPAPGPSPERPVPSVELQAEDATLGGGVEVTDVHRGYRGTGFVNFPRDGGYVEFADVDGGSAGGPAELTVRFALGNRARTGRLVVNGEASEVTFPRTGGWSDWDELALPVTLLPGPANVIRLESTGRDLANVDQVAFGRLDERSGSVAATGRAASTSEALRLYPNPNDGRFTLALPEGQGGVLRIADSIGRVVATLEVGGGLRQVTLPRLPAGLYFAIYQGPGGPHPVVRFVKR